MLVLLCQSSWLTVTSTSRDLHADVLLESASLQLCICVQFLTVFTDFDILAMTIMQMCCCKMQFAAVQHSIID